MLQQWVRDQIVSKLHLQTDDVRSTSMGCGGEDEKDLYKAVLEEYKYNREYLLEQGQLLWIRKKKDKMWTLPEYIE